MFSRLVTSSSRFVVRQTMNQSVFRTVTRSFAVPGNNRTHARNYSEEIISQNIVGIDKHQQCCDVNESQN